MPTPDPLQPGQAQAGDAAEIRRWVVALVDEVTAIGLESVVRGARFSVNRRLVTVVALLWGHIAGVSEALFGD